MSKRANNCKESAPATEALDGCYIFTFITRKETWKVKLCNTKTGPKNLLEIPVGMMDRTSSKLIVWGNGQEDGIITFFIFTSGNLQLIDNNFIDILLTFYIFPFIIKRINSGRVYLYYAPSLTRYIFQENRSHRLGESKY